MNTQLKDKGIEIVVDKAATKWLATNGYDSKMGARPLARLIDEKIKSPLSRRVLFGDLVDGGRVTVSVENNELSFTVAPIPKPITKEERKARKAAAAAQKESEINANVTESQDNSSEVL